MATPHPLDTRPLTEPIDRAAMISHARELRRTGRAPSSLGTVLAVVAIAFAGVMVLTMLSGPFAPVALAVAAAVAATTIVVFIVGAGRIRAYRLDRFARANGMTWTAEEKSPELPGMIFGVGSGRLATDIVRGSRLRPLEVGNYRYTTGSGKNKQTHRWGYVALRLSTPLPHIVLDAVGNNTLFGSNLPASFDRDQHLSLEGDFDRYFRLFCPRGYERDALYLFTPDIMARFVDNAAALDVEIVDDRLFLYGRRELSTLDAATWEWLFSVVDALGDKLAQWERWRDERLVATEPMLTGTAESAAAAGTRTPLLRPPAGVAASGRRLDRRVPWATIIGVGVGIVLFLLIQTGVLSR